MVKGSTALFCLVLLALLSTGCGEDEVPGTLVRVSNGTAGTLLDLTLVMGRDTLAIDSLTTGSIAEWTRELGHSDRAVFHWTISGRDRTVDAALIDSASASSVIEFFIPPGDVDLTISYHF